MKKGPPFLLLVVCSSGCGTNADVDLRAQISDRGTRLSVVVEGFRHGAPVAVPFDDASAVVHVRGQSIALVAGKGELSADFTLSQPAATDEPFEVEVSRNGETTTLAVQAPAAIDLLSPFPAFVPRSQDLMLAWTTVTDDDMNWRIDDAECLVAFSGSIDVGSTQLTIPASRFVGRDSFMKPTCGSEFYLLRYRTTMAAASGFAAASLSYLREIDAPFASTP